MPDAAPHECVGVTYDFTPISVTGTTPYGDLSDFHYAFAVHLGGFCLDSYVVRLTPTAIDPVCSGDTLELTILGPFDGPNPHAATAQLLRYPHEEMVQAHFDATRLDTPDATPPHIAGHFISDDPTWTFDIAVDLVSQMDTNCL